MLNLYTPPDLAESIDAWKANCGPAALAATISCPMCAIREFFPRYPGKPWTNPTHMMEAIRLSGRMSTLTPFSKRSKRGRACPIRGVMFLQFSSPKIDVKPILAQYQITHWVATVCHDDDNNRRPYAIYDINAGWLPPIDWEREIWPCFQEATGATEFWCRSAYEVTE